MKTEDETVLMIRGLISQMSAAEQEACYELAEHFKRHIRAAGTPVGELALALVGAEARATAE